MAAVGSVLSRTARQQALAACQGFSRTKHLALCPGSRQPGTRYLRRHSFTVRSRHHRTYSSQSKSGASIANAVSHNEEIAIAWTDGREARFSNEQLLDHCRCSKCFHPQTKQRLKSLTDFDPLTTPRSVETGQEGIKITWATPEPHESFYPSSFLERISYTSVDLSKLPSSSKGQSLWGSEVADHPPTVTYDSVMVSSSGEEKAEKSVLSWMKKVHKYGFCFVTGVPVTPEATEELINRIGIIRQTHYGGFWDFTADMSHGDLAYSSQGLPAHTDTTYFTDPAGLQIFHLLSHPSPGKGGKTLLVDGFYAAQKLAEKDVQAYMTLADMPITYHASGNAGVIYKPDPKPVLNHRSGLRDELVQVRWNNEDRGVIGPGWEKEDVHMWYKAAREFEGILKSKDTEYWVQLEPGTVCVIDNWRVMHGRSAFTGSRRMCGAYIGRDDWRSRLKVLERRFAKTPRVEVWDNGWEHDW